MKVGRKYYWRLPWGLGEVQYGTLSHTWTVWWRGRRVWPRRTAWLNGDNRMWP